MMKYNIDISLTKWYLNDIVNDTFIGILSFTITNP